MKALKIISLIFGILIILSFITANIFYQKVRKLVDANYLITMLDEANLKRFGRMQNLDYSFEIFSQKDVYYPYEKIRIFGKIVKKTDMSIPENAVIEIRLLQNNRPLRTISGDTKVKLIYNPQQQVWIGNWFPENTGEYGDVVIRAEGFIDSPEASIKADGKLFISETPLAYHIEKGLAFFGIESRERISKRSLLSPEAREVNWHTIPQWVKFVSADGVFMLAGITKTFDETTTLDNPWDRDKINEAVSLAERIRQSGGFAGVWLKTLELEGNYLERVGYKPAYHIKDNAIIKDNSVASIKDEERKRHIIRLFSTFMDNNNIAYVGLSHIFNPPSYDIELFDSFIREFKITVPENWENMSHNSRLSYFNERMKTRDFADNFAKWKNFVIADYLREIIDKSGHKKPVFYYASHNELSRNPEMISILFSSGVDFIVLNLSMPYNQIASEMARLRQINDINRYHNRLILSYEIDYNNVDMPDFETSAIENYVNANLKVVKLGSEKLNAQGLLINDLYKAMFGKRGPYSPYDWMLGAGKSIYEFKRFSSPSPLQISYFSSPKVTNQTAFTVKFKVANTSTKPLYNISIRLLPGINETAQEEFRASIQSLEAGSETYIEIPVKIDRQKSQFVRKKHFLGMRVAWSEERRFDDRFGYVDFIPIMLIETQDNAEKVET
jgi:hypothetical protein